MHPYEGVGKANAKLIQLNAGEIMPLDKYLYDIGNGRKTTLAEWDHYLRMRPDPMIRNIPIKKEPKFIVFKTFCYFMAFLALVFLAAVSALVAASFTGVLFSLGMCVVVASTYVDRFTNYLYKKRILK